MIYYSQGKGVFLTPGNNVLSGCYSGGGPTGISIYRNNPEWQFVPNWGSLPQGQYTISPEHTVPHLGPCVMALTPSPDNEMFGRSGFFIHGDNPEENFTASDGCIVCNAALRQQIADLVASGESQLTVTA